MPSDKINILECLVKAQHFQRVAEHCEIAIRKDVNFEVWVDLMTPNKQSYRFIFWLGNTFQENAEILQDLEELFYTYEKEEE